MNDTNEHIDKIMLLQHKWSDHDALYYYEPRVGIYNLKIFEQDGRKVACLFDLIVPDRLRGKGNGRLLLLSAKRVATFLGCSRLCVWTDCEPWVVDWYKRVGFVQDDSMLSYEGKPALVLELNCKTQ